MYNPILHPGRLVLLLLLLLLCKAEQAHAIGRGGSLLNSPLPAIGRAHEYCTWVELSPWLWLCFQVRASIEGGARLR